GGNRKKAFDRVDAELAKVPGLEAVRLTAKGHFFKDYAWEARGSGYANTVTEEGARKMHERLAISRKALVQPWALQPALGETANQMLGVILGQGGSRAEMEKWFERAMKADNNNSLACWSKLQWLDPKWYGTQEEMLEFGRACRDTKNWRGGLPLILAEAH